MVGYQGSEKVQGNIQLRQRTSVSGIIFREYHQGIPQILIARKKLSWILPGGKQLDGERDDACLDRELGEELGVSLLAYSLYDSFEGVTPHTGDVLKTTAYFAHIRGEPSPRAEILETSWTMIPRTCELSDITRKIVERLYVDGHLRE